MKAKKNWQSQRVLPEPEIGELWSQTNKLSKKEYRVLIVNKYLIDSFGTLYKVFDLEKEVMLYLKFNNITEYEYAKI